MSGFNATPVDGSSNPIPMSSAIVPGDKTPRPVRGGPAVTDSQGNVITDVAMYTYDGDNETVGAKANTAITDSTTTNTGMSFIKGLVKILADMWDNTNHRLNTTIQIVAGTAITNTNPVPAQDIEQANYIALTSPPTTTNAGSDTALTFSSQVSRVIIQNNTPANANYAFDTAASAGSLLLVPGAMLVYPKKCTVFHLYTAAAQNLNGTAAANIVVLGAN